MLSAIFKFADIISKLKKIVEKTRIFNINADSSKSDPKSNIKKELEKVFERIMIKKDAKVKLPTCFLKFQCLS